MPEVVIIKPGDSIEQASQVRTAVFTIEQGFSPETEMDDIDQNCHHILLLEDGIPIGTGRIFPDPDKQECYHIGRVAVLSKHRGNGTGRLLMQALEDLARSLGATEIELGAQCQAQPFYGKIGYEAFGKQYMDEHCPHICMRKSF